MPQNFKIKVTNSEVSLKESPFVTHPFKTFWVCDNMLAFKFPPKWFLERKMLDIWNLAINGEKHNVPLLSSYQTDFLPLKEFRLPYKQLQNN